MSIAEHAAELYTTSEDAELLLFATQNWPADLSRVTVEHAELARFAGIAAYRSEICEVHVWRARAIAAAGMTGNLRSLALSMQQHFFVLTEQGHTGEARQVLDIIDSVAAASTVDGPPTQDLVDRIVAERRGYIARIEGSADEAQQWYARAKDIAPKGSRDAAKVDGGSILATWLGGGSHAEAAAAFAALVQRAAEWPDVHGAAETNRAAADREDRDASVPFDLT